nr:hypothetical protein [Rhodothermus marinus]
MPAAEQADQQAVDQVALADDHAAHFGPQVVQKGTVRFDAGIDARQVERRHG